MQGWKPQKVLVTVTRAQGPDHPDQGPWKLQEQRERRTTGKAKRDTQGRVGSSAVGEGKLLAVLLSED